MAFQDFDQISERRRRERQKKFRKRVIIAAISTILLVGIIAGAVVIMSSGNLKTKSNQDHQTATSTKQKSSSNSNSNTSSKNSSSNSNSNSNIDLNCNPHSNANCNLDSNSSSDSNSSLDSNSSSNSSSNSNSNSSSKSSPSYEKVISSVCNTTNYKETCQKTLENATRNGDIKPKDFVHVSIKAADNEVDTAVNKISSYKFNSEMEKAAFEDCKKLMGDAKKELNDSISKAKDIQSLSKNTPDLNNWLSAVMSYQETCIDGFPDGKLKNDVNKTFEVAKQLTSNSLATIFASSRLLSSLNLTVSDLTGGSRRLLEKTANKASMDQKGFPSWISLEGRRMLKSSTEGMPKPNATVAKDGSGNYTTISAAVAAIPTNYSGRYVIYVKTGIYEEMLNITKENVTMYGDGSQKSVITGNKSFADGVPTIDTATFAALGDGFLAKALGFRNTAGAEKHQALALRVQADRAVFVNCRFEGYQNTLLAQAHRQFYRSCVIEGTVDFIFGDAAAVFQNCEITVRKPLDDQKNTVTAHGRIDSFETTGFVLQNCKFLADDSLEPVKSKVKTYFGRPWKPYARTIIMESKVEDIIDPEGWVAWSGDVGTKTLYYAEFKNEGPGSSTDKRVNWAGFHVINDTSEAMNFTVGKFLNGVDWINSTDVAVPIRLGLADTEA